MQKTWQIVNRVRLINFSAIAAVLGSIMIVFAIQFGVEHLSDKLEQTKNDIANYENEMQMLEIEWVYLTRPERLRELSANYLKNSGYTVAKQIKKDEQLNGYYLANYRKSISDSAKEDQVSF